MEPIVSPWLIYFVSIIENLRGFFEAVTFIVMATDIIIVMGSFIELDDVSVIISDFVKQNSNLKVCNVHPKGNALVGYIKDFDDFDYGTITIEPVEV